MLGELGPIWPRTWKEIWLPLLRHPEFGDDLALNLFREHVKEPAPPGPISALTPQELTDFQSAMAAYEETRADAAKARASLRRDWFRHAIEEVRAVGFLERSFPILEEYGDGNYSNRYFVLVDAFLVRYSLRYDLRRPLTLHPTLPGMFASLLKGLRAASLQDPHVSGLLSEFEEALRDLKGNLSQARIKTCLQKQFNLLEAIGRTFPSVTTGQTLGDIASQINSWPHATVREALRKLYGFRSDYPGLGHAGNPNGVIRDLDARDIVAIAVLLAGFVPYLSAQLDSQLVYGG